MPKLYFEEKIIDGRLQYRCEVDGNWTQYSLEQMAVMYLKLKKELEDAKENVTVIPYTTTIGTSYPNEMIPYNQPVYDPNRTDSPLPEYPYTVCKDSVGTSVHAQ